jgi:hypothetical protein
VTLIAMTLLPGMIATSRALVEYREEKTAAMRVSFVASSGNSNSSSSNVICESVLVEQLSLSSLHTAIRAFHSVLQVSAHDD